MYLEKLEIQGFKSFANKNRLIFSGLVDGQKRGITAIVGPNGSGKSNIADAIRWALGEQSLKTLRGKKSEDVIFSGSDKKNQLSFAEVSLFLNNEEKITRYLEDEADPEKNNELDQILKTCKEIVITRRIFRSGESEYLLNNNRVRLADIQMLLAKANFGQKTYSVIGQGMVENFLNTSAAERKDFFDEATGVKQFQIKRDAALNKLESSYENLQQVDMLLSEIKPRLKSLTRQVDKLKRRDEIEKNLKAAQLDYYSFIWQDINKQLNNFNNKYLDLEKVKIEKEKKLDKLDDDLNRLRATDNFREINELQPRLRDLESQKNQLQKKFSKLQAELELQLESQGQFDVSWLNNKSNELEVELENLVLEINSLEKSRPKNEEASLLAQLKEIDAELDASLEIKKTISNLEQEKLNLNRQLTKLEAILEASLEASGQFNVSWLNNKKNEINSELEKITEDIFQLEKEIEPTESEKLKNKLQDIQTEMNRLNQKLNQITEKIKVAAKSGGKNEEISRIVNEFLKKLDDLETETDLNKLRRLINEAKTQFQAKIKVILTGESDEDSQQIQETQTAIIALAEKKQALNDRLNDELLRLNSATEKLRIIQEKKERLNKELAEIKVSLEKAQTKFDGQKIENEKVALNRQLKELTEKQRQLSLDLKDEVLVEKKQSLLESLQACRLKDSTINERLKLINDKKSDLEKEIADLKEKMSKAELKFDAHSINEDKEEINKAIEKINAEIKEVVSKLDELNAAKEKEKNDLFACQKNIQSLQQEISKVVSDLNELKINATRQETKLEELENNIRSNQLDITEISRLEIKINEVDLERLQKNIAQWKSQLDQIGGIDPETEQEFAETKTRYDFLNNQTTDLNQAIKSLEQIIYELDLNIKSRFDQEFKIISEKFNDYFKILFNGGNAKISKIIIENLEKEENKNNQNKNHSTEEGLTPAEMEMRKAAEEKMNKIKFLKKYNAVGLAGIDIQTTPPSKKIQTVAMLSGGERALTAIALICAIISANPSPFVVLDEVDAALDESNSERLAKILDDLSNKTQFIVVTHNRASMRRASILYGVIMQTDGVSQILSVKLDEAGNNFKK